MLKVKPEVEVNWSVMIDSSCKINLFSLLYGSSMPASTLPFLANIFFLFFIICRVYQVLWGQMERQANLD